MVTMEMPNDNVQQLVSRINKLIDDIFQGINIFQNRSDLCKEILLLKYTIHGKTPSEVNILLQYYPISKLFQLLHPNILSVLQQDQSTSEDEFVETTTSTLSCLFSSLSYSQIEKNFVDSIKVGLTHPNGHVRYLSLTQVEKATKDIQEAINMLTSDVYPLVLECLEHENINVAEQVVSILTKMARIEELSGPLYSSSFSNIVKSNLEGHNSVLKSRTFDLIIKLATTLESHLSLLRQEDIWKALVKETQSSDVLSRIAVLEMLPRIASIPGGISVLRDLEIVSEFEKILSDFENDDWEILCEFYFQFLGQIAIISNEISFIKSYQIVNKMMELLKQDKLMNPIADFVGALGFQPAGVELLSSYPELPGSLSIAFGGQYSNSHLLHMIKFILCEQKNREEGIKCAIAEFLLGILKRDLVKYIFKCAITVGHDNQVICQEILDGVVYYSQICKLLYFDEMASLKLYGECNAPTRMWWRSLLKGLLNSEDESNIPSTLRPQIDHILH